MNNLKNKLTLFLLLLLPIAGILVYYLYGQIAIEEAYAGRPDNIMQFFIDTLYPRFNIEKNRFDLAFFIHKAEQVLYRSITIYYLMFSIGYFYKRKTAFREKINSIFIVPTSSQNINALRCIFFSYLLYLTYELCHDLIIMQPMKTFYKPIFWLRIFHIPFPGEVTIWVIGLVWCILNLLTLFRIRIILCSSLSLVIFLLFQCWIFSFEKLDHGYVTFTYAFILLPFLFDEQKNRILLYQSWALPLIRISIASVYMLSALEKIFISKLSWLNPENLKGYLFLHETTLSKFILQHDFLCLPISVFTLTLQLSFVLIVFFPKYKWIWLLGGILFHTGTYVIMNIGHPLNPWILAYIFFIDWTKIYAFIANLFTKAEFASS